MNYFKIIEQCHYQALRLNESPRAKIASLVRRLTISGRAAILNDSATVTFKGKTAKWLDLQTLRWF